MMLKYLEMQDKASKTKDLLSSHTKISEDQTVQFTTVEVHFVMSGECFLGLFLFLSFEV